MYVLCYSEKLLTFKLCAVEYKVCLRPKLINAEKPISLQAHERSARSLTRCLHQISVSEKVRTQNAHRRDQGQNEDHEHSCNSEPIIIVHTDRPLESTKLNHAVFKRSFPFSGGRVITRESRVDVLFRIVLVGSNGNVDEFSES